MLIIFCLLSFYRVYAQSTDYVSWTGVKVSYGVSPKWSLNSKLEYRTKENFSVSDRVGLNMGLGYKVLPDVMLEGSYEVHYRNTGNSGWKFRHRYKLGGSIGYRWIDWKVSLRELFQQTFSSDVTQNRLRSRLMLEYAVPGSVFTPYFSCEIYQPVGDGAFFSLARVRYRPGVELDITRSVSLDLFYCRQKEDDVARNVFGIECSLAL